MLLATAVAAALPQLLSPARALALTAGGTSAPASGSPSTPGSRASGTVTPSTHKHAPAARPTLPQAQVSFEAGAARPPVAQDFLGLSFEVAALAQLADYGGEGNLVTLLRSLGPGVVRFGGVTADEDVGWSEGGSGPPKWAAQGLGAASLYQLGALARASGWKVLLTLGLGHFEPEAAAREAAVAKAALGEQLEAIEIGNEPDSYTRHGLRSLPWTFVQYAEQVNQYRSAIETLAPGIPLAGPDTSGSSAYETWGLGEAIYERPAMLTGHHYPLSCNEQPAPSIPKLLSVETRALEERSLRRYLRIARESEVPFRMDETGSVSCGGVAGVSNTFASALWALGYLTRAMTMGAAGINFEGNPVNCDGYTPLCAPTPQAAATGALQAQPEWYALLLARQLVGERPLPTAVTAPGAANLDVTSFRASDGTLHFVAIDDEPPGTRPLVVGLQVGAGYQGASVMRLTAPSLESTSGVELGGAQVAADGEWTQPSVLPRARNRKGVISVTMQPGSAALLTVLSKSHG
jgi:hypothetical protein